MIAGVGVDAKVCGKPMIATLKGGSPVEWPAEYRLASATDHGALGVRRLFVQGALGGFMDRDIAAARAAGGPITSTS